MNSAATGSVQVDAVLAGSARFDFTGNIKILPVAHGADGKLSQHSLLLSEDARANSIPALEIEANDVKAFHAATAGPIDPMQRYFLMSRGLSESQAEEYIVKGFANRIMRHMPEKLQSGLDARLSKLFE